MVVVKNTENMFWGVTIDAGKRYSQVVKQGFHVSMAALEANSKKPSENVQVMLQHESSEYLLCTLHSSLLQQPLDLNFATGEQVSFSLNGSGVVHLTGYLIPEDEEPDFDEDYTDSEEEELPSLIDASGDGTDKLAAKRKAISSSQSSKKIRLSDSVDNEESDDEIDDDEEDSEEEEGFSDDFNDDEFDDEDEEDEEETTPEKKGKKEIETPTAQKNKHKTSQKQDGKTAKDSKTPKQLVESSQKGGKAETISPHKEKAQKQTEKGDGKTINDSKSPTENVAAKQTGTAQTSQPSTSGGEESAKKKKKKKKKKNKEGNTSQNDSSSSTPGTTPKAEATPKKRVVAGGTIVEDMKVGNGPEAKPGKMVSVYYVGTLSKNNKRFDSCTEGKPFRFRLNQGEVIKGWDNGVLGMKVGGKRRITVPANQGYGNVKQGPIPPNSTLVFEVELKAVS